MWSHANTPSAARKYAVCCKTWLEAFGNSGSRGERIGDLREGHGRSIGPVLVNNLAIDHVEHGGVGLLQIFRRHHDRLSAHLQCGDVRRGGRDEQTTAKPLRWISDK